MQRFLTALPLDVERRIAQDDAVYNVLTSILIKLAVLPELKMRASMSSGRANKTPCPWFVFEYMDRLAPVIEILVLDELVFHFWTAEDVDRFTAHLGLDKSARVAPFISLNPGYLKHVATVSAGALDAVAVGEALNYITKTSKVRRVIPQSDDTELHSLCRGLNASQDAYHVGDYVEGIAKILTPDMTLELMDVLATTDPWAEEDYENCLNNALMILDDLVTRETRCHTAAQTVLIRIRDYFSARGTQYIEDVAEVDALLDFIVEHKKET